MKTDMRRLAEVLRDLRRLRVVCLVGDDADAVRAGARHVVAAEAGSADDPFQVRECDGENREAIEAAWSDGSLTGMRPVLWVRHATERLLPAIERALAGSAGPLVVLEYGASTSRSRLRRLVEASAVGYVIACYVRADATRAAIRSMLDEFGVAAPDSVVAMIAAQADSAECPGPLAGLMAALLAGQSGRLDAALVSGLLGAAEGAGLEAGLLSGLAGDVATLDAALSSILGEGSGGIGVLRAALIQIQRARTMALMVNSGRTLAEAGRALRPPLFFRNEERMADAVRCWSAHQLGDAARIVWEAERASKATGMPQDALSHQTLLRLAQRGPAGLAGPAICD